MADSAQSTDPLERYGAIERAYCEERWTAVIHDGQTLLGDLSRVDAAPPEGLKERLQLLIGHAFLYGLGDRDSAEDLYQAVLRSEAEASLRQIAEQGLQQCALPITPAESQDDQLEREGPSSGPVASQGAMTSPGPDGASAEAWVDSPASLDAGSTPAPQENPQAPAFQGLQEQWDAAAPQAPSGEAGALSWLTAEAKGAPENSAAQPVMPWLQATPAAASAGSLSWDPAGGVAEPAVSQAPVQPAIESLPPQEAQASLPAASARMDAWPEPLGPAGESSSESAPSGDEEKPPLFDVETAATLQATAAAAVLQPSISGMQPAPADEGVQPDRLELSLVSSATSVVPSVSPDLQQEPLPVRSPDGPAEERLVAEIVDEPELIELYQADSLRRQELLIHPEADPSLSSSVAEGEGHPPVETSLPLGWDRRGSQELSAELPDEPAEQALEPQAEPEPAPQLHPVVPSRPGRISSESPPSR